MVCHWLAFGVRGGELRVDWAGPGEPVWLTGPAEIAFEGHFELRDTAT